MIKKYHQYIKESLLDKISGPTEEEIINNLEKMSPNDAMVYSLENNLIDEFEKALSRGADITKIFFIGYKGYSYNVNSLTCCAVMDNEKFFDYILKKYGKNFDLEQIIKVLMLDFKLKYIEKLLDYGVDFNVINNMSWVHNSNNKRNHQLQELLKKYGSIKESLLNKIEGPSEEEIYNNLEKMSPEKMLIKSVNMEYMKGIKHAINLGANINKLTSTTFELLMHYLYQSNETELLYNCIEKYFIKKVNNKQYYFYSCVYGYFEGVKNALEKYNIKPRWNDGGLYGAIKFNNINIVIYLLKRFESTQNAYEWENEAKEIAYKLNNRNVLDYIYKNNGHDI